MEGNIVNLENDYKSYSQLLDELRNDPESIPDSVKWAKDIDKEIAGLLASQEKAAEVTGMYLC
jgi:hypothetical protein